MRRRLVLSFLTLRFHPYRRLSPPYRPPLNHLLAHIYKMVSVVPKNRPSPNYAIFLSPRSSSYSEGHSITAPMFITTTSRCIFLPSTSPPAHVSESRLDFTPCQHMFSTKINFGHTGKIVLKIYLEMIFFIT
ncbi:hypothetical protein ZOSMA_36G00070 [Zostera marina]|uniref:Uncharacterized protein n=1 Tax=Zostera marina TaxID=29655 RepID=A0A0K9P8A1_ZOSMR|nr:hypothetical protein ZOSMA_36G00070 [Zostera marina]